MYFLDIVILAIISPELNKAYNTKSKNMAAIMNYISFFEKAANCQH